MPVHLILAVLMIPMSAVTFLYNQILGIAEMSITVIAVTTAFIVTLRFRSYIREVSASAMRDCFSPDQKTLEAMKTPVVVAGEHGELIAYNARFRKAFLEENEGENSSINPFIGDLRIADAFKRASFETEFGKKRYTVFSRAIDRGVLFEFIDDTYYKNIADTYHDTKKSVALIVFDNIEDFSAGTDQQAAVAHLIAEDLLYRWATKHETLLRKLGENRYIAIFDEKVLRHQMERK